MRMPTPRPMSAWRPAAHRTGGALISFAALGVGAAGGWCGAQVMRWKTHQGESPGTYEADGGRPPFLDVGLWLIRAGGPRGPRARRHPAGSPSGFGAGPKCVSSQVPVYPGGPTTLGGWPPRRPRPGAWRSAALGIDDRLTGTPRGQKRSSAPSPVGGREPTDGYCEIGGCAPQLVERRRKQHAHRAPGHPQREQGGGGVHDDGQRVGDGRRSDRRIHAPTLARHG